MATAEAEPIEQAQAAPDVQATPETSAIPTEATPPAQAAEETPAGEATRGAAAPATQEGQQPGEQPGALPPAAQTTDPVLEEIIERGDLKELNAYLRDQEKASKLKPAGAKVEAAAAKTAAEATPGEQPGVATPQDEPDEKDPDRIRIKGYDETDRNLILSATRLSKAEGIPFRDAYARISTKAQPVAAAPKQEGAQPPAAEQQQKATPIEETVAKIETIRADLKAAMEGFDYAKQVELQDKLAEAHAEKKMLEAKQAQAAERSEQTAQTQWKDAEAASFKALEAAFPDVQKANTPLNAAVTARIAHLEKVNPAFFHDPEWLSLITSDEARKLGVQPAAKPAAAKPATPVAGKQPPVASQPPADKTKVSPRIPGHPAAIPPAPGSAGAPANNQPSGPDIEKLAASSNERELLTALREQGRRKAPAAA